MSTSQPPPPSPPWSADDADWLSGDAPDPVVDDDPAADHDHDATGLLEPADRPVPPTAGRSNQSRGPRAEVLRGDDVIAAISGAPADRSAIGQELAAIAAPAGPPNPSPVIATAEPVKKPTRKEKAKAKRAARTAAKRARRRLPFWRGRVLPRSVLGLSLLMLAAGIGAAASGTALYMNYQYRRDQSDALVKTFPQQAKIAVDTVNAEAVNARRRIQDEIEPIRKLAATGDTLRDLLTKTAPSVFAVTTYDVDGAPSVGTAFVVASDASKSFLLTSLDVVRAGTARPAPAIKVRQGNEELEADLWTWDDKRDLALLIVPKPSLPRLEWAISSDVRLGQQVFAVSGVGTAGGAITQGFVADVSTDALQHTAPLGTHFRGGPVLTDRGTVVAIASRTYEPLGFRSDGVWFAPPIRKACVTVLKCPPSETTGSGQVTGAGSER